MHLIDRNVTCVSAHGDAYERKGLIHRDISAGNVLIYPDATPDKNGDVYESRVGLLADWEIAERISENGSGTSASGRMVSVFTDIFVIQ